MQQIASAFSNRFSCRFEMVVENGRRRKKQGL